MKFTRAAWPLAWSWASPFVRWQGALADVSSLDFAAAAATGAFASRGIDTALIDGLVFGQTIPQAQSFYGPPWLASRLGLSALSGPTIAQACATSVACLVHAALQVESDAAAVTFVLVTDRTSNGPLLVYPRSQSMGGSPTTEHWVLDSFAADPNTGLAMVATAENVARDGRMSRQALDELTLLRWSQYESTLADDRAIQRRYLQPIELARRKGAPQRIEADEGIQPYTAAALAALKPVAEGGVVTFGTQTHPADGCAGTVLMDAARARGAAGDGAVVRLLSSGVARADKACMPKAATTAAQRALEAAGLKPQDVRWVVTHNPFAVNDLWFAQQTGIALDRMNPYGCSLIYGHPQGPTGLRGITELAHALHAVGGGIGLFTGCAAGDTGAAVVLRVD